MFGKAYLLHKDKVHSKTSFDDAMLLPPDIVKTKRRKRNDLLRAAKAALRYLRRPERCEAKGIRFDDVVRRLDVAIKLAHSKSVKRQTKMPPYDENIII